MTDSLVGVQHSDGIRTVTLDSPHNRNALSARLLEQLDQALRDATSDPDVRAIVLTGSGRVFCSGADLTERGAAAPNRMPDILTCLVESPVPVIARVNGHARAGGLGLVAASDLAAALEASTFAFTEVRVGVAPAMILVPALRVVDRRFLARTTLTGETFSAAGGGGLQGSSPRWPRTWRRSMPGSRCRPRRSASRPRVRCGPPRRCCGRCPPRSGPTLWRPRPRRRPSLFAGAEAAEGMEAFLQKRRPSWDTTP